MSCCALTTVLANDATRRLTSVTDSWNLNCDLRSTMDATQYYRFANDQIACGDLTPTRSDYVCGGKTAVWKSTCDDYINRPNGVYKTNFTTGTDTWEVERCVCQSVSYYKYVDHPKYEALPCPRLCSAPNTFDPPMEVINLNILLTQRDRSLSIAEFSSTYSCANNLDKSVYSTYPSVAFDTCVKRFASQWIGIANDIRDVVNFIPNDKDETHTCVFVNYSTPEDCLSENFYAFRSNSYIYHAANSAPASPPPLPPSPLYWGQRSFYTVVESTLANIVGVSNAPASSFQACEVRALPNKFFSFDHGLCSITSSLPFLLPRIVGRFVHRACNVTCSNAINGVYETRDNLYIQQYQYDHWVQKNHDLRVNNITIVRSVRFAKEPLLPCVVKVSNPYDIYGTSEKEVSTFQDGTMNEYLQGGYCILHVQMRSTRLLYTTMGGVVEDMVHVLNLSAKEKSHVYTKESRITSFPLVSSTFEYAGKIVEDLMAALDSLSKHEEDLRIDLSNLILNGAEEENFALHVWLRQGRNFGMNVTTAVFKNPTFYPHIACVREMVDIFQSCGNGQMRLFYSNPTLLDWKEYARTIFSDECALPSLCPDLNAHGMIETSRTPISISDTFNEDTLVSSFRSLRPSMFDSQFRFVLPLLRIAEESIPDALEFFTDASFPEYGCDIDVYDTWKAHSKVKQMSASDTSLELASCPLSTYSKSWILSNSRSAIPFEVTNTSFLSSCCFLCARNKLCRVFSHSNQRCFLYEKAVVEYSPLQSSIEVVGGFPEIETASEISGYNQTSMLCVADSMGLLPSAFARCNQVSTCKGISCTSCENECKSYQTCQKLLPSTSGCALQRSTTTLSMSTPYWVWFLVTIGSVAIMALCVYGCNRIVDLGKKRRQSRKEKEETSRRQKSMQPRFTTKTLSRFNPRAKISSLDQPATRVKYDTVTPNNSYTDRIERRVQHLKMENLRKYASSLSTSRMSY